MGITGNSQLELLMEQAQKCAPRYVVIADDANYKLACELASQYGVDAEILSGAKALEEVSSAPEVDAVMAAIVGAAGLEPTLAAVKAGKRVLLANKESLVMSGALFLEAARQSHAELKKHKRVNIKTKRRKNPENESQNEYTKQNQK